jgi:hypothetical protein
MKVEPQAEHRWLQQLAGDWTFETTMGDKPSDTARGREEVRLLGDIWIVGEGEGEMPGFGIGRTMITLGYDPTTRRFRGTWVGSMMTALWVYEGTLEGNVLTLDTEGPDFVNEGCTSRYRDVIELVDPDHRVLRSQTHGEDGKWTTFMTTHYRRER